MITVLYGDKSEELHIETLTEALALVPGIEISMSNSGIKQIVMRGVKSPYRDKIKLMIDGVEVNNDFYDNQYYYLNFPVDLIERIEIIRGPGSVLYGENAFIGVIDVITKINGDRKDSKGSYRYDSLKERHTITLYENKKIGNWNMGFDVFGTSQTGGVETGDIYNIYATQNPYRKGGISHEKYDDIGFGVRLKNGNFTLLTRLKRYKRHNYFGVLNLLPLKDDKDVLAILWYMDAIYDKTLTERWTSYTNLRYREYIAGTEIRLFPYTILEHDYTPSDNPDDDLVVGLHIKEENIKFTQRFNYKSDFHDIKIVAEAAYSRPIDSYYQQYVVSMEDEKNIFNLGPYGEELRDDYNIIKEGIDRKRWACAVEDMFFLNPKFIAVGGIRYDNYSDFGSNWSYRASLLYKAGLKNSFKLLFQHAFRAPSWLELYSITPVDFKGNPSLSPERIDTYEAGWVFYPEISSKIKINGYYSEISNTVVKANGEYENGGDITLQGFEASWDKVTDDAWQLGVNYSYTYPKDENGNGLPLIAHHLIKVDVIIPITDEWRVSTTALGVSSRSREEEDLREKLDGYFDGAVSVSYKPHKDMEIWVKCNNIFDSDIRYPSEINSAGFYYVNDLPRYGRFWSFGIKKSW